MTTSRDEKSSTKTNWAARELDRRFKQFRLGMALFFFGLIMLYCISQLLVPSLQQEIMAALALLVLAVGFVMAVMAEVRIVLFRIINFFSEK